MSLLLMDIVACIPVAFREIIARILTYYVQPVGLNAQMTSWSGICSFLWLEKKLFIQLYSRQSATVYFFIRLNILRTFGLTPHLRIQTLGRPHCHGIQKWQDEQEIAMLTSQSVTQESTQPRITVFGLSVGMNYIQNNLLICCNRELWMGD